MFTHLFGVDKVSSGAKTRVGIGYSGDSDDDGQGEESLGNHFVCGCTLWIFIYWYFVAESVLSSVPFSEK